MWEREESLTDVILDAWEGGSPCPDLGAVASALQNVMKSMQAWSREKFGSVRRKLEELRVELASLNGLTDDESRMKAKETAKAMNEMLYREEMMWLQRSRINWLKEGDRNTRYFHRKARWRAKKNRIRKLKREDGSWCANQEEMKGMASQYFSDLFSKDMSINPDDLTNLFDAKITLEMNRGLCRPYSEEEIGNALFQIGPLKAPGPDGFPAQFFQRNWGLMKADIITAVQNFFETGVLPDGVNDTCIVLIPKIQFPEQLKDFRPISLCNVIYKVVSKCLVNRLRPILEDIISPNQSAFIPGRMITDNALIAFECIHTINSSRDDRGNFCAYKLDLSKAYDRVDWDFLNNVLLKMGFQSDWVQRVMTCVTSVRYSVRFNGSASPPFSPTRGLRQGDHLSQYLFLFIADGLSGKRAATPTIEAN